MQDQMHSSDRLKVGHIFYVLTEKRERFIHLINWHFISVRNKRTSTVYIRAKITSSDSSSESAYGTFVIMNGQESVDLENGIPPSPSLEDINLYALTTPKIPSTPPLIGNVIKVLPDSPPGRAVTRCGLFFSRPLFPLQAVVFECSGGVLSHWSPYFLFSMRNCAVRKRPSGQSDKLGGR